MSKEIEKTIEGIVEMRRTFWNAFFLVSAGIVSLVLNLNNYIKFGLLIVGLILLCIIIIIIYQLNIELSSTPLFPLQISIY